MTVLSAQSIRRLCIGYRRPGYQQREYFAGSPLITPFVERGVFDGKSFGLSACTYDCRIAKDRIILPGEGALVSTVERFCFPANVCGSVLDKSSYARVFVSAFNTHLDPGWEGFLTVELVNFGRDIVTFKKWSPLCQIKFEWLDAPTELPYAGKYQNQESCPVVARMEKV